MFYRVVIVDFEGVFLGLGGVLVVRVGFFEEVICVVLWCWLRVKFGWWEI